MKDGLEGQMTIFDLDPAIWSGRTSPGPSAQTKGKTSKQFSPKSSESSERTRPMFLYLIGGGGASQDASWVTDRQDAPFPSLGDYTTRSFGVYPREENVLRFSQISEGCPHPKYNLSAKACAGILRRAERRGKILPPELKAALERQAGLFSTTRGGQQITVSEDGILPTLRAETHGNLPCVIQEPKTYFIQGNCIDRADNAGCNGRGWNDEVCYTLNTIDRPAVYESEAKPIMIEMTSTKNTIITDGISPTITARMGTGGNQVNCVFYAMQGFGDYMESDVGSTRKARDYKDNTDLVLTVDCRNGTESEINGTLQEKPNGGLSLNTNIVCRHGNTIRRITPLECERMQGYPDGWTDIGEWVDSKGKKHKESDSPRYKALGNSIAVGYANNGSGFWMWLLKRISAQYERNATLGSLFDGIGGFPLAWEHFNGKGSARWASEIEEFPIAVTKKHFPEE